MNTANTNKTEEQKRAEFDAFIEAVAKTHKGNIETVRQWEKFKAEKFGELKPKPRNERLFHDYVDAAKRAQSFTDPRFNDEAVEKTRQEMFVEVRNTYLPQIEELGEQASEPVDPAHLATAVGVDFNNTAAVNALQVKWPQVAQLLDAGKSWEDIIEQADQPMLAAIVEHAPTHLQIQDSNDIEIMVNQITQAGYTQVSGKVQGIDAILDNIRVMVGRKAVQLGNLDASRWLNERAWRAYDTVIAQRLSTHAKTGLQYDDMFDVDTVSEGWLREAETRSAVIRGVATPLQREHAEQQAKEQREFQQELQTMQEQQAKGETPDQLASEVERANPNYR